MAMSRKEFEMLADRLAAIRPDNQASEYVLWAQACIAVADVCNHYGPNFDSGRFRHACMTRTNARYITDASAVRRIES